MHRSRQVCLRRQYRNALQVRIGKDIKVDADLAARFVHRVANAGPIVGGSVGSELGVLTRKDGVERVSPGAVTDPELHLPKEVSTGPE